MPKFISFVLWCLLGFAGPLRAQDSLYAVRKDGSWAIKYTVKPGETLRMLSLRFCISEGQLATVNDPETITHIVPGTEVYIPVAPDNFYTVKQPLANQADLNYKVDLHDDIGLVSTYSGVTKSQMRSWNNLKGNTIKPGQILFVGWIKMIRKDTTNPATLKAYPSAKKLQAKEPGRKAVPGPLDSLFNRQTNSGLNVLTEKGTAVFFEHRGHSGGAIAFHNTMPRGTVIKVVNPSNGKSVFVKVLGAIPETKQYSNAIIGISSEAKEALGVMENKAWVELTYMAN